MLVGRRAETEALDRLLVGARTGESGVLVIRGEAGIGKSALLEYAGEHADGMAILRGVGIQSEADLAFAGLHQLLRPVLDRLVQLPEPQAEALRAAFALSAETVDDRFRVALGVLGLLSEAAEEKPLLCLVDDAQWLDGPSSEALLFAARRLQAEPIAILLAVRDDPARPFVAAGVDELRLPQLAEQDARALARQRLRPETPPEILDRLLENAHGNPLALIELSTEGALDDGVPQTTSVEETYLERIRGLPDEARSMLVLAAAEETGDRGTIARAADELGLDEAGLAAAEADGLVIVSAQRVDFRHPLVRSAAYRGVGFVERERAHRALAAVLTGSADADRRAWHRAAATVGADDEVAAELELSANRARQRAGHGSAAAALARAAELSTTDAERGRRLLLAARSAGLAPTPARTIALAERAQALVTDPAQLADLAFIRGTAEMDQARTVEASDLFASAASAVARHDPRKALELTLASVEAAALCGDGDRVGRGYRIGGEIEIDRADGYQAMLSMVIEAGERIYHEDPGDAAPLLRTALGLFAGSDNPRHNLWAGTIAVFLGDPERACELYGRAVTTARAAGALGIMPRVLSTLSMPTLGLGQFGEAAALADEAARLAHDIDNDWMGAQAYGVLAMVAGFKGHEEDCRRFAARTMELSESNRHAISPALATWALAELELGKGQWDAALGHYQQLREVRPGFGHPSIATQVISSMTEAAVRAGRPEAARSSVDVFGAWTEETQSRWFSPRYTRCRALLAESPDKAVELYEEALELHERGSSPFEHGRTHLLYGELLRRLRRRTDARVQLRAALQLFERVGVPIWAERAQAELRATGETARRRDASTVDQLTPQELQIARLVGEGASNKEVAAQLFLSPRTVEYHLRKVFMKLGISSRAELIRQNIGAEPVAVV